MEFLSFPLNYVNAISSFLIRSPATRLDVTSLQSGGYLLTTVKFEHFCIRSPEIEHLRHLSSITKMGCLFLFTYS